MSSGKVSGPATDDDQSPIEEFYCFHFLLFPALLLLPLVATMSDHGVLPAAQQALSPGHPGGLGALSGLCPGMDRVPCITGRLWCSWSHRTWAHWWNSLVKKDSVLCLTLRGKMHSGRALVKKSRELGWDLCSTILVNSLQDRIKTRQLLLSRLGSGWNLFSWVSGLWTGKKLITHNGTMWHGNYRNETKLHIEQDRQC